MEETKLDGFWVWNNEYEYYRTSCFSVSKWENHRSLGNNSKPWGRSDHCQNRMVYLPATQILMHTFNYNSNKSYTIFIFKNISVRLKILSIFNDCYLTKKCNIFCQKSTAHLNYLGKWKIFIPKFGDRSQQQAGRRKL